MDGYVYFKVLHLAGAFLILMPLAALILHRINGGTREQPWRKPVAMTHGLGMLFSVMGGFGMLPALHLNGVYPIWLVLKMVIWVTLGLMIGVVLRKGEWAKALWFIVPLLGILAAFLGVVKPFY